MKNYLAVVPVMLLLGCISVPVEQTFPKVPVALQEAPPELKEVPENATADQVFGTVIDNYGTYHVVAEKLRSWQQWYNEQKKIFDDVN